MPTGYIIPAPPKVAADAAVKAHTTTENLAAADFPKNNTNTGASGNIVLTLPAAASVAGQSTRIQVTAAHQVSLSPAATEAVYLGGDGVVDKDLVVAGTIGNFCDVYSDGKRFLVLGYSGVVTKEA
jgi:hypothetical protein